MNHDATPELIISSAASKSSFIGVFSMFFGWLVSANAAIVVGTMVAVIGLLVNWYYRRADHKLRAAAEAREAALDALREARDAELDALRKARLQRDLPTDSQWHCDAANEDEARKNGS